MKLPCTSAFFKRHDDLVIFVLPINKKLHTENEGRSARLLVEHVEMTLDLAENTAGEFCVIFDDAKWDEENDVLQHDDTFMAELRDAITAAGISRELADTLEYCEWGDVCEGTLILQAEQFGNYLLSVEDLETV